MDVHVRRKKHPKTKKNTKNRTLLNVFIIHFNIGVQRSHHLCSHCDRPVFNHFWSSIEFKTIGVCYRLPLYTVLCFKCIRGKKIF